MKVLITGAHFTTAVAVIEELQKQKDVELVYVGRKTTREGDSSPSPESQILPAMGVKFIPIITGRLQRSFTIYTIPSLFKIPIGFLQAFWIILNERPNVILSFGGYVAVPLVIIGWLFSIPIIIHEQTLVTGLANKISSWFANKIAISFDTKNDFDKNRVVLTGNPLRKEIINVDNKDLSDDLRKLFNDAKKNNLPVILVTGGNQGSHVINKVVEDSLDQLSKLAYIIHQTGDSKFKDFEKLQEKQNGHYLVRKFIYKEMPYLLKNADLVISRAGINTLTELAYLGTPALVIPVDYLYQDEQNKNADFFEKLGLVKKIPQSKFTKQFLIDNIQNELSDLKNVELRAKGAKDVVRSDAASMIALETTLLATQK